MNEPHVISFFSQFDSMRVSSVIWVVTVILIYFGWFLKENMRVQIALYSVVLCFFIYGLVRLF